MTREELEARYGEVWTTAEATKRFAFVAFGAPFVKVIDQNGVEGTLEFQHRPRFYFNWRVS